MKATTKLEDTIPAAHVMLLHWVRMPSDDRFSASSVGNRIIPAKGCIAAARELDTFGDRTGAEHIPAGHGVTILWASGRKREVRANG